MTGPDRLSEEALRDLLDGSLPPEAVGTPLASFIAALRHDAERTPPRPTAALSTVLAEGLAPAGSEAVVGRVGRWSRTGLLARAAVAKFAALGLLTKAAAAGAAVTVAASGAGAAGVLPPTAQHAFDDAVGRLPAEAPPASDDDGAVPPVTPADTSTTPPLERDLSDDATGVSDGEVGVDGPDVADDASDGRSERPEETTERTPPAADAGTDRAEDAVQDAPAEQAPDEGPPTEPASATPGEDRPAPDGSSERAPADPDRP